LEIGKLVNYWIFKVRADSNGKETLTGLKIFKHRMSDMAWGIKEFTEKGRKTPNSGKLEENDKVLFYLCGKEGSCILGTAVLETGFGESLKSVFHSEYNDWVKGVRLSSVDPWTTYLPMENLRGKVRFVPEGENFGSYIQGSITKITKEGYETVINEHRKIQR
jgi:hypothetical protein